MTKNGLSCVQLLYVAGLCYKCSMVNRILDLNCWPNDNRVTAYLISSKSILKRGTMLVK